MAIGTLADARQPELLIATAGEGVLAFDGQRFRQIRPAQAEARLVTAVLPLASGRLLLGTAKRGLLVYDGKALRSFHSTTDHVYVTALAGTEADLWIGTLTDGVLHWRGGETERIGEEQGLPDARVESIALDDNHIYIGTPVGVADLEHDKLTRVLADGRFAKSLLVKGNTLLVGQLDAGVKAVSLAERSSGIEGRRPIAFRTNDAGVPEGESRKTVEQFFVAGGSRYAVVQDGLLEQEPGGEWRGVLNGGGALLTDRNVSAVVVGLEGRLVVGYFDR
jgi:ligand-binding sensor domain-containing protein